MNTEFTIIYIIRHGETEANVQKQYGLNPETVLTKKGQEQAKNLSRKLDHIQFSTIFHSDLVRARQTAEILAEERDLVLEMKEALRERSYGKMNGNTKEQMREELKDLFDEYEKLPDKDKYYKKLVDDMESVEEVVSRFITVLREIAIAYSGKNVLIISHATLMRGILIHLGFADFHEIDSSCIENTAYIKIESDGVDFFVKETFGIRKKNNDFLNMVK